MDTQPVAQARPVLVTLPAEIGITNARDVHQRAADGTGPG